MKRNEAAAIVFQRFGSVKANLTRIQAQNLFFAIKHETSGFCCAVLHAAVMHQKLPTKNSELNDSWILIFIFILFR
ncbi:hypothetical protein D3C84_498250 [compost metagenome]